MARPIVAVLAVLVLFEGAAAAAGATSQPATAVRPASATTQHRPGPATRHPEPPARIQPGRTQPWRVLPGHQPLRPRVPLLPGHRTRIFDHRFLVVYYGTPQTTLLGVLGEGGPGRVTRRLRAAARPFHRPQQRPQIVYEVIATVVDGRPGAEGDYSHEIPRRYVEEYLRAAHRNNALVLLDVQPGRSSFPRIVKRWAWALKDPWVGLALDPEWRMGPHQRPGRVFGHVTAREVNQTSRWLDRFTARHRLPQKLLVLHQFRTAMVRHPARIRQRRHLVLVQHVDGYGPPRAKLATYHHVARPGQFRMGFKLFYDEDKPRMSARRVLRIRPRVDFVSFQ